jgi:hypothetical protein
VLVREEIMAKAVFCIAKSDEQAVRIVDGLKAAGFSNADISALFPDTEGTRDFAHEQHTKAPEAATTGAAAGGVTLGVLGWLVGIGSLAIPGLGPFIAAGPIMAALSSAAIGGAVGGLAGGLIGLGMPEYEAKRYEGKLKEGNILISVHTEDAQQRSRAKEIFEWAGADDISYTGEAGVPEANRTAAARLHAASMQRSLDEGEHTPGTEPAMHHEDRYSDYEPAFRENFASTYQGSGRSYHDYDPAYRFGYMLAHDTRYADKDWEVVEPEAKRAWVARGQGAWEDFKNPIRYAWERAHSHN